MFSLIVFLLAGHVNILYGLVMAIGSFFGGMAGSKMVILKGSKLVRPIFMIVVGITILVFIITKILS